MKLRAPLHFTLLASLVPLLLLACTSAATDTGGETDADGEQIPRVEGWNTDWSINSIDLNELAPGIGRADPRDAIPPIDDPEFESVDQASDWLSPREPVAFLELNGEVRAYPVQILTWHEIVNDQVGDTPIAVTYCPLCNSAVGFDRRVNGETLRLGVSGLLRNSDLVMWDRQTESLWQQITGEAIVGELTGKQLDFIPLSLIAWNDFKEAYPDGRVLSRETGHSRAYGSNPYTSYDSSPGPFLFDGELDDRYPAMERVVGVDISDETKAYPFSILERERAVNDEVAGRPIVVFWGADDTASALDTGDIAAGRAVGAGLAFDRTVQDQVLTFEPAGEDTFTDNETGSTWDILGHAVKGPLTGEQLQPVVHANHLWFAWAAFNPDSPVYDGDAS